MVEGALMTLFWATRMVVRSIFLPLSELEILVKPSSSAGDAGMKARSEDDTTDPRSLALPDRVNEELKWYEPL